MKYVLLAITLVFSVTFIVSAQQNAGLKMNDLTYSDRQKWRNLLNWSDECEEQFDSDDETRVGLKFWNFANNKYLAEVSCGLSSYQGVQVYFLYDKTTSVSKPLRFSIYYKERGGKVLPQKDLDIAGYPSFDNQSKVLIVWTKFRGDSDCGSLANYKVNSTGIVELKEFRAKYECDGKETLPENYPRIFPK